MMLVTLILLLSGCVGSHPFLMIQICLEDDAALEEFARTMRMMSESNGMIYIDRSRLTQKEMESLDVAPDFNLVNVGAKNQHGVGWGASNYSLSEHELVIGFSEGSDPAFAHDFSEQVVARLSQEWRVHRVSPNRGATARCQER